MNNYPRTTHRDPEEAIEDFRDHRDLCEETGAPLVATEEMHQWFIDALMGFEQVADFEQRTICTMARVLGRESEITEELAEAKEQHGAAHVEWLMSRA